MAAKGWLNKMFGGKKEEPIPSRPSTGRSGSSKPSSGTSTPSGPSTNATMRAASGGTPNQSSQDQGQPPMSEFMASAMAAAESGMTWENRSGGKRTPRQRVIDETTDLSSLTDQEIVRLMEGMQGDVLKQPLLTGPVPLLAIKQEYLHGSKAVLRKLEDLEQKGWDQAWRARGDGDCFYRSFTLAYLLRILYAPNPRQDATNALAVINKTMPSMQNAGFQADIVEEFLEPLISAISSFLDPAPGSEPTEYSILQILQDPEKSNYIVVALRLITGAYIRTHEEKFAGFCFSPVTLEPISPEQFSREEVEPCGKEADNVQITALASALNMPVRVAYLDQSQGDDVWLEVGEAAASEDARPLTLLYRPGHFDVVTKDNMHAALARQESDDAAAVAAASTPKQKAPASPSSPKRSLSSAKPPQQGLHIVASTETSPPPVPAPPAKLQSPSSSSPRVQEPTSPQSKQPSQSSISEQPLTPVSPPAQTIDKGKGKMRSESPDSMDVNIDDGRKETQLDEPVKERGD